MNGSYITLLAVLAAGIFYAYHCKQTQTIPQYELIYFNGQGRAEVTRYVFKVAGIPFFDRRLTNAEWPALKTNSSLYPFKQLPVLLIDGKPLPQSSAIERYLGHKFGLFGNDPTEQMLIDAFSEQIFDLRQAHSQAKGSDNKTKVDDFYLTTLPNNLKLLELYTIRNGLGLMGVPWAIGQHVSLADLRLHVVINSFDNQEVVGSTLAEFPRLKAITSAVSSLPAIKQWLIERPLAPF